jgi:hypothetical protein
VPTFDLPSYAWNTILPNLESGRPCGRTCAPAAQWICTLRVGQTSMAQGQKPANDTPPWATTSRLRAQNPPLRTLRARCEHENANLKRQPCGLERQTGAADLPPLRDWWRLENRGLRVPSRRFRSPSSLYGLGGWVVLLTARPLLRSGPIGENERFWRHFGRRFSARPQAFP